MAEVISDIFDKIIHPKNLYSAAYAAADGKRSSEDVSMFMFQMEREIAQLHWELKSGRYRHGPYRVFKIYEPKARDISKALFRDRVVHHAIHDVIEPIIDRSFIFDSYACRVGKGTHVAIERAQSFLHARGYCLHGDIRKYFPSIDRDILKRLLRWHIADDRLLGLMDHIIDSSRSCALDIFRDRGLPIGNLTSQFFANLYLHELDHFVKHTLKCRYYIRYMDDFLLFDDDHAVLTRWCGSIKDMLADSLHLRLHSDKTQIFCARKGLTFLGFHLSRGRRRISAQGMRRVRARIKNFRYLLSKGLIEESKVAASMNCWHAHSAYADASRLRARLAGETAGWSERVSGVLGVAKSNP